MPYQRMTPSNVEPCVRKAYDELTENVDTVWRYECPRCHELHEGGKYHIEEHLLDHAIEDRINELFQAGKTLKEINDLYHMFDGYTEEAYNGFKPCHYNITKDSCFKISYLQCCEFPAYRICHLHRSMKVDVWGVGRRSGGYGSEVGLSDLSDPRPLSELYVCGATKSGVYKCPKCNGVKAVTNLNDASLPETYWCDACKENSMIPTWRETY